MEETSAEPVGCTSTETRKGLTFVRAHWFAHHAPDNPFCPSAIVPGTELTILAYCTEQVKKQLLKRQKKTHSIKKIREPSAV
jgi:hypothetical protein